MVHLRNYPLQLREDENEFKCTFSNAKTNGEATKNRGLLLSCLLNQKVDKSIDRYCVAVPVSLSSSLTLNNYLYEVHDVNEFS